MICNFVLYLYGNKTLKTLKKIASFFFQGSPSYPSQSMKRIRAIGLPE